MVASATNVFLANAPQINVEIDRIKAETLGVPTPGKAVRPPIEVMPHDALRGDGEDTRIPSVPDSSWNL